MPMRDVYVGGLALGSGIREQMRDVDTVWCRGAATDRPDG